MLTQPIPTQSLPTWSQIDAYDVRDNGEALVLIPDLPQLKSHPIYHHQNITHAIDVCVARQTVVEKLQRACLQLPAHLCLVVLDGWRSRQVQQALQSQLSQLIAKTRPELNQWQQQALLAQFVAPVSPTFVSPHLTGGSVDVTLLDLNTHQLLDMGSEFDEPSERSHTTFYENQPHHPAQQHRRLLYHIMISQGFANLSTEWWHFDYGNALWAWQYQHTHAIYGASQWH